MRVLKDSYLLYTQGSERSGLHVPDLLFDNKTTAIVQFNAGEIMVYFL